MYPANWSFKGKCILKCLLSQENNELKQLSKKQLNETKLKQVQYNTIHYKKAIKYLNTLNIVKREAHLVLSCQWMFPLINRLASF